MDDTYIKFSSLDGFRNADFVSDGNIAITVDRFCTSSPTACHRHDYYEFEYISEGEGVQIINGRAYTVRKGDIIFFRLTDYHTYYTLNGIQVINCCFKREAAPDISLIDTDPQAAIVLRLSEEAEKEFMLLLGMIRMECEKKRPYLSEATACYIRLLLIFLRRNGYLRQDDEGRWNSFLVYLSGNYRTVTLPEAAACMYVSKNHFCALFKKRFGCTFLSYINKMRLNEAKRLLSETDLPISQIQEAAGFSQAKQFYISFRRENGITPLEYRRKRSSESPL